MRVLAGRGLTTADAGSTAGGAVLLRTTLWCYGAGESDIGETIKDLMQRGQNPTVGTTAQQTITVQDTEDPVFVLFLSSYDKFSHQSFFSLPWQVAWSTSSKPSRHGCSWCRRRPRWPSWPRCWPTPPAG